MEIIAENNIQDTSSATQYKTPSYTRRAIDKYKEKNREMINQKRKERFKERYANDPEFREKQKQQSILKYQKKKLEKENQKK
jgi:hypothetical protein